jgi:hypothetical protein
MKPAGFDSHDQVGCSNDKNCAVGRNSTKRHAGVLKNERLAMETLTRSAVAEPPKQRSCTKKGSPKQFQSPVKYWKTTLQTTMAVFGGPRQGGVPNEAHTSMLKSFPRRFRCHFAEHDYSELRLRLSSTVKMRAVNKVSAKILEECSHPGRVS